MTTIIYTNSYGITAQWKGQVINFDETSISIKFSKNKALKFRLKDLGIDLVLVTKTKVKQNLIPENEVISFDADLKAKLIESQKDNTAMLWTGSKWEIQ